MLRNPEDYEILSIRLLILILGLRVENAIRPFVIGRKNWLFAESVLGAHVSATLYSVIETAKACGHEPYKYLKYVFERLPVLKPDESQRHLLPYFLKPNSY